VPSVSDNLIWSNFDLVIPVYFFLDELVVTLVFELDDELLLLHAANVRVARSTAPAVTNFFILFPPKSQLFASSVFRRVIERIVTIYFLRAIVQL
jgi:hypothetical protein